MRAIVDICIGIITYVFVLPFVAAPMARTRRSFTAEYKLAILTAYEAAGTNEKIAILRRFGGPEPVEEAGRVATAADIMALAAVSRQVHVDDAVAAYVVALTRATREHEAVELGASPRAGRRHAPRQIEKQLKEGARH